MKTTATLLAALALAFGSAALAEAQPSTTTAVASANDALSEGVVRKVDKDAGKVTIKHGPLANLGMPAMTMVFRVKDPKMLDELKADESIRFRAEQVNGALTVTRVEPKG